MRGKPTPTERSLVGLVEKLREAPRITIAIFGAGKDSPDYPKREDLQARLEATDHVDEVIIPEALDVPDGVSTLEMEQHVVERSQLVVLLEGPSDPPRGMWTEMIALVNFRNWHKFYYIRPQESTPAEEVAIVDRFVPAFADAVEHWTYRKEWWAACDQITQACRTRVGKVVARHRLPSRQPPDSP